MANEEKRSERICLDHRVPVQPSVVEVPVKLYELMVQLQYCGELALPLKLGT